jgi:DNA-binding winged helix-turn-helix (wHTH) protein/Tfp pilus assembly protein PilF
MQNEAIPGHVHRGYQFGAYSLDIDRTAVIKDGQTLHLRRQSFDVLLFLVERAGRLVRKEELLAAVWGNTPVTDDSLTHCLIDIRKLLGDTSHELIRTVPRRGFIFEIPVKPLSKRGARPAAYMAVAACLVAAITFLATSAFRDSELRSTENSHVAFEDDAVDLYQQANILFHRRGPGDMESARSYFLRAIENEPDFAAAWAGVAATHFIDYWENKADAGRLALIKEYSEKSIAIDPDNLEGRFRLARYYQLVGDDEAANRHLQHAFSKHPENPLVLSAMAGQFERRGDVDRAIELSFQAVRAEPLSLTYRQNLATYLLAAGRFVEAIEQSQRIAMLSPDSADMQPIAGLALVKLGRYREALDMALAWPHFAQKYEVTAMAYFGLGNNTQAQGAIAVLKSFPEAGDALHLAELQAYCDEVDMSFRTLTTMRGRLITDAMFKEMHRHIESIQRSPFMANVRSDERWAGWLQETQSRIDEKLVLSFR